MSQEDGRSFDKEATRFEEFKQQLPQNFLNDEGMRALFDYLQSGGIQGDEGDPIFVVHYLNHLSAVGPESVEVPPAPGMNRTLVQAALNQFAIEDIGGMGVNFKFQSHTRLLEASLTLSGLGPTNIPWAFYYPLNRAAFLAVTIGPAAAAAALPTIPTIKASIITFYSTQSNKLTCDPSGFFLL